MTAVGRQREREIASFDEGELWFDDDAEPPLNPAGWYFRSPRGGVWVGPFDGPTEAAAAPAGGDPLRDARKYLDRWRRGGEVPLPKVVVFHRPLPLPPMNGDGQFELAVGAATAPREKPSRTTARRAARTPQLALPLGP